MPRVLTYTEREAGRPRENYAGIDNLAAIWRVSCATSRDTLQYAYAGQGRAVGDTRIFTPSIRVGPLLRVSLTSRLLLLGLNMTY